MIICSNCETSQFLQIVTSRVYFDDGEVVAEIDEEYECTLCGGTGGYEWDEDNGESISGDVEQESAKPRWNAT